VTMEQRAFLAVVLMAAILVIYQIFFIPTHEQTPTGSGSPQQPAPTASRPPTSPAPAASTPRPLPAPAPSPAPSTEARPPQRLTRVSTPLYETAISSEGGKLQELTLNYRGQKPMIIVGELGPTGLMIGPGGGAAAQVVPLQAEALDMLRVGGDQPQRQLVLSGTHDGLRVRQTLTFRADSYAIGSTIRVENTTSQPRALSILLPWTTRQDWRDEKAKFQGQHPTEILWSAGGAVIREENLCHVQPAGADGSWVGLGSIWYMVALVPQRGDFRLIVQGEDKACESKGKEPVGRATIAVEATPEIAPGQAWEGQTTIFVGPKEYDRLKALGLESAINFGGFPVPRKWGGLPMEWLGVPILLLMNWVYHHVGNYGIAIILLTVVSKVLFYPLTVKSMRSMRAMQALQPQINSLRNKYKSDPQRLQKETMDLYRQHKVNPMGGCLPMVAQVPIFYALYLALSNAVELQGAEFLCASWLHPIASLLQWFGMHWVSGLWICNLADPDPLYVLPILMGITMFFQQKMTPTAGDPRQAKMMLVMPFVFTFMFLNLPAGLVLYWTVSNLLQILQQWFMDRPSRHGVRGARDASRA
jgi:YidC/Oxa1 family membrane protein insertase